MFIGFIFTFAIAAALISLISSTILFRKELQSILSKSVNKQTLFCLVIISAFFLIFSLLYVHPVEQLYFDENIYQGIAMNILAHGNALWCQYGTGFVNTCFNNAIYHDLIGYPFLLAISFAIFGIGVQTAFATQLFVGLLSIIFFFLLSSVLFEKKSAVIASTIAFALIPQIFIWSRTQAIPDLALMAFATLTFFFFILFSRRQSIYSFAAFASSLCLTAYMRIEGILLVPIFFVLLFTYGEEGIVGTLKSRISLAVDQINNNTKLLVLGLIFLLLLLPDFYYIALQISNPSYGQDYTNQQVFSFSNFMNNINPNIGFFLGTYNQIYQFPLVFPWETTALAVAGMLLIGISKMKNKWGMLLLLLIWAVAYHLFYDFFYAGAATFGVDDRFMLQLVPPLSLLAGVAISQVYEFADKKSKVKVLGVAMYAVLIIAGLIVPFIMLIPNITLLPQNMPQQTVIYDALSFFYSNYNSVPSNCLVFTFTPDLWYEVGRSAAQIDYINSNNAQFLNDTKNYTCRVIDYGYWCSVPPYKGTTCNTLTQNYNLIPLATHNNTARNENFAFYQITGKK